MCLTHIGGLKSYGFRYHFCASSQSHTSNSELFSGLQASLQIPVSHLQVSQSFLWSCLSAMVSFQALLFITSSTPRCSSSPRGFGDTWEVVSKMSFSSKYQTVALFPEVHKPWTRTVAITFHWPILTLTPALSPHPPSVPWTRLSLLTIPKSFRLYLLGISLFIYHNGTLPTVACPWLSDFILHLGSKHIDLWCVLGTDPIFLKLLFVYFHLLERERELF